LTLPYFLLESGLHYNWHRHYDPTLGRYIQADPNRDVQTTRPINLDGSILTTNGGVSGGFQLALSVAASGDFRSQIRTELPEFIDGPSIYAYARSAPTQNFDSDGLQAAQIAQGISYCVRYPSLCAATIKAGIDACYQTYQKIAGRKDSSGGDRRDELYYNVDIPVCKAIARRRGKQAAEKCYASAAQRYGNCIAGRPMPPLDTWNN
jgi:uncharacterized protein RhaS with RHS repeats